MRLSMKMFVGFLLIIGILLFFTYGIEEISGETIIGTSR